MTLGVFVNWAAGALLAFTIFFYVVIYTMWLKRWTPQNIVIGGAAGSFPPMIGWAAATGTVSLESVLLFLIIFLWTPPHFWALALFKSGDYATRRHPDDAECRGRGVDQAADFCLCAAGRRHRRAALGFRLHRRCLRLGRGGARHRLRLVCLGGSYACPTPTAP